MLNQGIFGCWFFFLLIIEILTPNEKKTTNPNQKQQTNKQLYTFNLLKPFGNEIIQLVCV